MGPPIPLNAIHLIRTAKVVSVLWLAAPLALAGRFTGFLASRRGAVLLVVLCSPIRMVQSFATGALVPSFSFHPSRLPQLTAPTTLNNPSPRKSTGEEDGRRG
jgi:hypothetical protein